MNQQTNLVSIAMPKYEQLPLVLLAEAQRCGSTAQEKSTPRCGKCFYAGNKRGNHGVIRCSLNNEFTSNFDSCESYAEVSLMWDELGKKYISIRIDRSAA